MRFRSPSRLALVVLAGVVAWPWGRALFVPARAQVRAPSASAGPKPDARADDRAAVGAAAESFVKAYNAGDVKALAALFADDAESVDKDGAAVQGRAAIASQFSRVFAADPGGKVRLRVDSLRFLGNDVAKEEGRCTVTPGTGTGGRPETDRYTVLYVRQAGRWLQSYVREHAGDEPGPHERLEDLAWLVGEWVDESPEAVIVTACKWSDDGNFLLRTYEIKVAGKLAMSGVQRIGWDAASGQLKSWVFDSQGGSSEGLWSRDGDRWVVKLSGPLQGGKTFSETNVFTRVNDDMIRWKSTDRTVAGQVAPDLGEFVIARKPPRPQPR
jgi:uncharacterized protein (TIGR02246 family)